MNLCVFYSRSFVTAALEPAGETSHAVLMAQFRTCSSHVDSRDNEKQALISSF